MGRALTLVILVVAIGSATSTGQGSESSWAALVGSLFGLEPLPPAQPSAAPPPVSLRQALDRAEGWVREHDLDTSGQFLHGVTLRHDEDPAHRGSYWLVQWSWIQPRLGGEVSIRVDMDGTVTARRLGP